MSFFFIWLPTQFSFISMIYGHIVIPVCKNFDGSFPNDSVHCEGYSKDNPCTNPKECCKATTLQGNIGCFNMSVLQAYGLWHPPPDNKFPQNDGSCTLKDNFFPQGNNTDKAADGQVIIQHMVITLAHCGDFCLREPQCNAFNLGSLLNREGKKFCELLQHVVRIVDRPGFSFWFFDRVAYKERIRRCGVKGLPVQARRLEFYGMCGNHRSRVVYRSASGCCLEWRRRHPKF